MTQASKVADAISEDLQRQIAADLRAVTARIAEIKGLSEWQLGDLADAATSAEDVRALLAKDGGGVAPAFRRLVDELSELQARIGSHVRSGRRLAQDFLAVARALEREFAVLRPRAASRQAMAGGAGVVSFDAIRAARSGSEAVRQRATDLHRELLALQHSVADLFLAQAQSGRDVTSLRQRMRSYHRDLTGGGC